MKVLVLAGTVYVLNDTITKVFAATSFTRPPNANSAQEQAFVLSVLRPQEVKIWVYSQIMTLSTIALISSILADQHSLGSE